jgi:transglutaminase-like putative cysteine protease
MEHLRIQHHTTYHYHRPVEFGRHRLVLRPREGHDVRVERMRLRIEPAHRLIWARDVFGNSVAIVDFTAAGTELDIRSDVTIRRSAPFPQQQPHAPCAIPYPVAYDALETTIAAAYLAPSYPDDFEVVQAWLAREVPPAQPHDAEATIHDIGRRIYEMIKYQRRMERGVQTPAVTLAALSGSCRDMATLLLDAARARGIAARFASGYLDCPASIAGRAAMHAWTEFYLPTLGWRGYDPTLGEPTSLKHVVVGVSYHPRGVMPVSGVFNGAASDYREMTARVKIDRIDTGQARESE